MNIFKTVTLKWWQEVIFKLSVVSLGIVIGTHWYYIFDSFLFPLLVVAIVCGLYILSVWWKE